VVICARRAGQPVVTPIRVTCTSLILPSGSSRCNHANAVTPSSLQGLLRVLPNLRAL
jgi:hypothetical protein